MAFTIIQSPGAEYSLHSALWHVVTSSNSAASDFRFVFDIQAVDQATATLVPLAIIKAVPDAAGYGRIDVSRIIRTYLESYFTPDASAPPLALDTNLWTVLYHIDYGEEYGSVYYPGLDADYYTARNSYHNDMPGAEPESPTYGLGFKWLTSRDINEVWTAKTGSTFLSYLSDPAEAHSIQVQELSSAGTPTGSLITSDPFTTTGTLLVLNLSIASIMAAAYPGLGIPAGFANVDGYRIRMFRADGTTANDWFYVRFLCQPKNEATALHFLNKFGGFDTFHFTGPTRKGLQMERKTFQRDGVVSNSGVLKEYSTATKVYGDTTIQYYGKQNWNRRLNSGYLRDVDHLWLYELIASPQVYMESNGYYYPVIIKTAEWSEKINKVDKMYNLEIEVETTRQVFSQSR